MKASDNRKHFNSEIYRRRIRRLVNLAKELHPLLARVPNRLQMPARDPKKREKIAAINAKRLTKQTLHYFADTIEYVEERRVRRSEAPVDNSDAVPKTSVAY